jgi:WD40 repeat protein
LNILDDANRFALRNRYIIDEAPLQIYISALLFAPSMSNIRQTSGDSLSKYFDVIPSVPNRWGAERQKLEGHDLYVGAVAFSPDGKTVASGSGDNTVRLWDVRRGRNIGLPLLSGKSPSLEMEIVWRPMLGSWISAPHLLHVQHLSLSLCFHSC